MEYMELYHCVAAAILSAVWAPSQYHVTLSSTRVSHRPGHRAFSSAITTSDGRSEELRSGAGNLRSLRCSSTSANAREALLCCTLPGIPSLISFTAGWIGTTRKGAYVSQVLAKFADFPLLCPLFENFETTRWLFNSQCCYSLLEYSSFMPSNALHCVPQYINVIYPQTGNASNTRPQDDISPIIFSTYSNFYYGRIDLNQCMLRRFEPSYPKMYARPLK